MTATILILISVWLLDGFDIVPGLLGYTLAAALAGAGVLLWIM